MTQKNLVNKISISMNINCWAEFDCCQKKNRNFVRLHESEIVEGSQILRNHKVSRVAVLLTLVVTVHQFAVTKDQSVCLFRSQFFEEILSRHKKKNSNKFC